MNSDSLVLPIAIHPYRTLISNSKYYKLVVVVISFKSVIATRRSSLFDMSTIFIDGFVLFSPVFFLKTFIKHSFCWHYSSLSHSLYLLRSMLRDWKFFNYFEVVFSAITVSRETTALELFYVVSFLISFSGLAYLGSYAFSFWIVERSFKGSFFWWILSLKNCLSFTIGTNYFWTCWIMFSFKFDYLFVLGIYLIEDS